MKEGERNIQRGKTFSTTGGKNKNTEGKLPKKRRGWEGKNQKVSRAKKKGFTLCELPQGLPNSKGSKEIGYETKRKKSN